jgi:hypothetical protein
MRTEGNTLAAVDADEGFTRGIEIDGAHGAGAAALFAADAEVLAHEYASSLPLCGRPSGRLARRGRDRRPGRSAPRIRWTGRLKTQCESRRCPRRVVCEQGAHKRANRNGIQCSAPFSVSSVFSDSRISYLPIPDGFNSMISIRWFLSGCSEEGSSVKTAMSPWISCSLSQVRTKGVKSFGWSSLKTG